MHGFRLFGFFKSWVNLTQFFRFFKISLYIDGKVGFWSVLKDVWFVLLITAHCRVGIFSTLTVILVCTALFFYKSHLRYIHLPTVPVHHPAHIRAYRLAHQPLKFIFCFTLNLNKVDPRGTCMFYWLGFRFWANPLW